MIEPSLLTEAHRLALQVAPELRQHPLYIMDSARLAGWLPDDCLGYADSGEGSVDFTLRDVLGDAWRGPGPTVVLFGDRLAADSRPGRFRDVVLQTAIHELGHLLPASANLPSEAVANRFDCPEMRAWQTRRRIELDARPAPPPGAADDHHGATWVRTTIHLWGRSLLLGWNIPGLGMFGALALYLGQPENWLPTLLCEIVSMRTATFSEIVATEPPQGFVDMWGDSLRFYRETMV